MILGDGAARSDAPDASHDPERVAGREGRSPAPGPPARARGGGTGFTSPAPVLAGNSSWGVTRTSAGPPRGPALRRSDAAAATSHTAGRRDAPPRRPERQDHHDADRAPLREHRRRPGRELGELLCSEARTAVDEPESAAVDRAVAEVRRVRSMRVTIAWIERASDRPRCRARPAGRRVAWRSAPRGDRLRHQSTASGGRGQGPGVPSPVPSPRDAVGGGHLMAERIAAAAPATSDAL